MLTYLVDVELSDGAVPGPGEKKAPWVERKVAYLQHLGGQPAHVLLVSAADKLHNARSTLADYRVHAARLEVDRCSMSPPEPRADGCQRQLPRISAQCSQPNRR